MKTRRVFVSLPADQWLTPQENETKWAIVDRIDALDYKTEIFADPRGSTSLSASQAWSAAECENVMRHCDGCVLLGFPRWRWEQKEMALALPTDYNHYEGALAHTLGLPLLALVQEEVARRVVFDPSFKGYVGTIPAKPTVGWLNTSAFKVPFNYWREQLGKRRDVFLGYCSTSKQTATAVKRYLTHDLGLRVLDWSDDFSPARTILQQIEDAAQLCGAGIFLFTKDDLAGGKGEKRVAMPRDNVVFEAGYFCALKGKNRVLIIREKGAKMPADLGGDIYALLKNKNDITPIEGTLDKFVATL